MIITARVIGIDDLAARLEAGLNEALRGRTAGHSYTSAAVFGGVPAEAVAARHAPVAGETGTPFAEDEPWPTLALDGGYSAEGTP